MSGKRAWIWKSFEGAFYLGLILGALSAVATISSGDRAFAAWGLWPRVAMVAWAAAVHALILGAAVTLVAAVLVVILGAWRGHGMPRLWRLAPMLATAGLLVVLEVIDAGFVRRGEDARRGEAAAERTNLVLIVVDALRADRLGCYGYPMPTSPHIDALARNGIVFERAVVQYPATGPSFGSLFTGKYPRRHGLSGMDPRLWLGGDFNLTLAEVLSAEGYDTGAIITGSLTRSSGLARGFDELFEEMPAYGTYDVRSPLQTLRSRLAIARAWVRFRRASDPKLVATEAARWIERKQHESFFLFLHLYDTHAPYDPPREYVELLEAAGAESHPGISSEELRTLERRRDPLSPPEIRRLNALYDAEVRSADASVGSIVEKLRQLGLLERTMIVLTADHGEELYEHGKLEHGHIFNTNLLVPLILAVPGRAERGRRIETPVELIDVLPTLLTLLGVAVPTAVDGRRLPLDGEQEAAGDDDVYAFAEADCAGAGEKACLIAVQNRRWKLTLDRTTGVRELFDLDADPLERSNVLPQNPDVGEKLETALRTWDGAQPDLATLQKRVEGAEISEEIRERLRQLGYIE